MSCRGVCSAPQELYAASGTVPATLSVKNLCMGCFYMNIVCSCMYQVCLLNVVRWQEACRRVSTFSLHIEYI